MFFSQLKQNENLLRRLTGGENGSSEYTFQAFDINVKLNLQVSLVKFDSPELSSIILAKSLLFGSCRCPQINPRKLRHIIPVPSVEQKTG